MGETFQTTDPICQYLPRKFLSVVRAKFGDIKALWSGAYK